MDITRKITTSILVFSLLLSSLFVGSGYAQEASGELPSPEETTPELSVLPPPVSSPTPISEVVQNDADVQNVVSSLSDSGENTIEIIEPTSTPASTPIPFEASIVGGSDTEDIILDPFSEITTGDSKSVVEVENTVNSSIVDSKVVNLTINVYLSEVVGDIDLTGIVDEIVEDVSKNALSGDVVEVLISTENNYTYVVNNIESVANTGENSITGDGLGVVKTGDAYSSVSVLNTVNSNIVDSEVYYITLNVYGVVEGNIIFPEFESGDSECCEATKNSTNGAEVVNNIDSVAVSGRNSATVSGQAEIISGDAKSVVNVSNTVNSNVINRVFAEFYINVIGQWLGNFLGWTQPVGLSDGCGDCVNNLEVVQNDAYVENNISSLSNTGANNIEGNSASIQTGNAYSSVSLFNMVNSNFLQSKGIFGFINIFGTLIGDIGGASLFVEEELPQEEVVLQSKINEQGDQSGKDPGGDLVLQATHNVGVYVLPGDTITFTAKVKNPGHGKLYETKVFIELFKDGESYGGTYFELGEIEPFKSLTLSTGIVLSKEAVAGNYDAVVTATGISGPDNKLSQSVILPFRIAGFSPTVGDNQDFVAGATASEGTTPPAVLGTNTGLLTDHEKRMIALFSALLLVYLVSRGYQKREIYVYPVARKLGDYALRIGSLLT